MSFCPIIEIFPSSISFFQTSDGRIILDIDDQTSVSLSNRIQEKDILLANEPIDDLQLSIPNTPKNFFYLKGLFDPNTDRSNNNSITVRIQTGSETFLHNTLFGVQKDRARILIRLTFLNNWIDLLKETKLSEINFGSIPYTKAHVEDVWLNNKQYADGDPGYWFPLVNYGAWRSKFRIPYVEDVRPFLHATFLLQKMFEHIGWCIESPFYETDFGRSLMCYLWSGEWGNSDEQRELRKFSERLVLPFGHSTSGNFTLDNWTEIYDNGNNFNEVTGRIEKPFEGKLILSLKSGANPQGFTNFQSVYILQIVKYNIVQPQEPEVIHREEFELNSNSFKIVEIDINIIANEYAKITLQRDPVEFLPYELIINLSNEVTRSIYAKDDTIVINEEFPDDITCWDVFYALQHLMYGIVESDSISKKVKLLTPYNTDIFGQAITGFFNSTFTDLLLTQPIDSAISVLQNIDQLRYILLGFAKSTDNELKDKLQANGTELFAKTIDLGDIHKRGTEDDRNPLFEGTALKETFIYGRVGTEVNVSYVRKLPALIDNDELNISYDIKPRIIYAAGWGILGDPDNEYAWETTPAGFGFTNLIAFAFNDAGQELFDGLVLEEKLIYGTAEKDLWSLVYGRFFLQMHGRVKIDLLAYLSHHQYFTLNLKNLFGIEYDGHPVTGRVLEINDYQPCETISTQLILLPEITTGNYCFESEPPITGCDNFPSISVLYEGNCQTFSISGTFDCAIATITWEKRIGTGDWEAAGTGSSIQLCDVGEIYSIRSTIVYVEDCECPDDVVTTTVFPCAVDLACQMSIIQLNGNQYIAYQLFGDNFDACDLSITVDVVQNDIVIATLEYPFGQGTVGDWTLITLLQNGVTYEMTVVVDCNNGCEDLTTTCIFDIDFPEPPPPPGGGCDYEPILVCVPVTINGILCYTFVLENAGDYQYFIVSWECQNGMSGQWMPGDDPICECGAGYIEANAMVHYCDCEPICTPYINCDQSGCLVVNAGTPLEYVACN